MAKTRGPLLSMRASGAIGQSQIYATWRGIPYVRQYAVPSNPKTSEQTLTRSVFAWLNAVYRNFGPFAKDTWTIYSTGRKFTDRNGWLAKNVSALREAVDLSDLITSPGVRSGPALDFFEAVPGAAAGEIDCTVTPGTLPTGWTVESIVAVAITDGDPHELWAGIVREEQVLNPGPYEATLTGLVTGVSYHCSGFARYVRPDGTIAISASGAEIALAP